MSDNQIDYSAVRRRVEEGLKRDKGRSRVVLLIANIAIYVMFMLVVAGAVVIFTPYISDVYVGAIAMLAVGWGVGVFLQLITVLMEAGKLDGLMRDRLMMRAIREEMMRLGSDELDLEKPKRNMKLTDDGELVEVENVVQQKQTTQAK
jgi:hypothetical protein